MQKLVERYERIPLDALYQQIGRKISRVEPRSHALRWMRSLLAALRILVHPHVTVRRRRNLGRLLLLLLLLLMLLRQ